MIKKSTKKKSGRKIINWKMYNQALVNRGKFMMFLDQSVRDSWYANIDDPKPGAQPVYSDIAIEAILTLAYIFKIPLRAATGFVQQVFELNNIDLNVPDYSTLSRRAKTLKIKLRHSCKANEAMVVSLDSTGLKIHGQGEWNRKKHGKGKRRQWVKLHIVISNNDFQIIGFKATNSDVADCEVFDELISHVPAGSTVLGDGAYGDHHAYEIAANNDIYLVSNPKSSDIISKSTTPGDMLRNLHVSTVQNRGFHTWANKTGYHRRNLVETTMGRIKTTFGGSISAIKVEAQVNELAIKCNILNKFSDLGMPERLKAS
jgi:hypothetical protein